MWSQVWAQELCSSHKVSSLSVSCTKFVFWIDLKTTDCSFSGSAFGSTCFLFAVSGVWTLWHSSLTSGSVLLKSLLLLLHRSCLCPAGCCASSLWSLLLVLPSSALHLFWHIQTCINGWAVSWTVFDSQISLWKLELICLFLLLPTWIMHY